LEPLDLTLPVNKTQNSDHKKLLSQPGSMKAMLNEKVAGFQFSLGDLEFYTVTTKYKMSSSHILISFAVNMRTPYLEQRQS